MSFQELIQLDVGTRSTIVPQCPGCGAIMARTPINFLNETAICRSCFKFVTRLERLLLILKEARR